MPHQEVVHGGEGHHEWLRAAANRRSIEVSGTFSDELRTASDGLVRDDAGRVDWDPNNTMHAPQARGLYTSPGEYMEMWVNDGTTRGAVSLLRSVVGNSQLYLEPPSDPTRLETEIYEAAAAWMGVSQRSSIQESAGYIKGGIKDVADKLLTWSSLFGFSVMNHGWRTMRIGRRVLRVPYDLCWVAPWSINRWVHDDSGNLIGFEQVIQKDHDSGRDIVKRVPGANESLAWYKRVHNDHEFRFVPIQDCLIHKAIPTDGHPESESDFRAAWPWHKAMMEAAKNDLNLQQRVLNGVTVIKEVEHGGQTRDWKRAVHVYGKFQRGETNLLYQPAGFEIDQLWLRADQSFSDDRMKFYTSQQSRSVLSMIMSVSESRGASKSIGDGLGQMWFSWAAKKAEDLDATLNGKYGESYTGLVSRFVEANWPDRPPGTRAPKIRHAGVEFTDVHSMTKILSNAAQFLLYTPDENDELGFRERIGLRRSSIEDIRKARKKIAEKAGQMSQQGSQSTQGPQGSPDSARQALRRENEGKSDQETETEKGKEDAE